MANFKFYYPIDMTHFDWLFGLPTATNDLTSTAIRMLGAAPNGDSLVAVYTGSFGYEGFKPTGSTVAEKLGLVSGHLTGYELFGNQLLQVHITGLSYNALEALTYVELGSHTDDPNFAGYDMELLGLMMTGNDFIKGSAFDDVLKGFEGNDRIFGGAHTDTLIGDEGNDTLTGGSGQDTLTGGVGSDKFVYFAVTDSKLTASDTITDFKHGDDKIDLGHIDANSTLAGDQGFTFISTNAFSNHAGELRWDLVTHILSGDVNGDGIADFAINVTGIVNAADFIL